MNHASASQKAAAKAMAAMKGQFNFRGMAQASALVERSRLADLRSTPQGTSGRSSSHRTPVSRSIAGQCSAGTFFRLRHMLGAFVDTPMASASADMLFMASMARSRAVIGCSIGSHDRENNTHTNVRQANATVTIVKTFADRLRHARERAKMSQAALAKKAGVSIGAIGNYETATRDMPRDLLGLAAALNVRPEWLQDGKGPMNREHPTQQAHLLGLLDAKLSSPFLEWGVIDMIELPKAFKVAAKDDSMAPRLKAGQIAEFEVGLDLHPGDGVLVRDMEGKPCIRRCRRVRGEWEAYAEDADNYLPFMIGPDQLLAVLVGVHARWG